VKQEEKLKNCLFLITNGGNMKKEFEYDVALSFAGEDRGFVKECAEILRSLNVNVFYDNYEKEVLLGKDLYSYLADIYQNRAHFAVVFF
jgi:hypothetical protein